MIAKKESSSPKTTRSNPRPVTSSSVVVQLDSLIEAIDAQYRDSRWHSRRRGDKVPGILVESDEWEQLVRLWEQIRPRPRGRPELEPSLFGNTYKEEFEQEKQKLVASGAKVRGAVKHAIAILAERYGIDPDAMRKRIYGRKIKRLHFREE